MKKSFKHSVTLMLTIALVAFSSMAYAYTHYVGSYVGDLGGTDIFIRDCNKFRGQFTATCGPHTYYNDQYYYGYNYLFSSSNDSYVDYEDLAFFSGHGYPFGFCTFGGSTSMSSTGDGGGDGWLKWIGFFTCNTITVPADTPNAWTAYDNTRKGVHVMCGFRTTSALADTNLPNYWAANMKAGYYVWYAWLKAVNESAGYYGSVYNHSWIGTAATVLFVDQYGTPSRDPYYDRLSGYSQKPSPNSYVDFIYQY